jgi:transaldolase
MTLEPVRETSECVAREGVPFPLSVFADGVADTGRDPAPMTETAMRLLQPVPNAELTWAGPCELLNIFQADAIGHHILTVTNAILIAGSSP